MGKKKSLVPDLEFNPLYADDSGAGIIVEEQEVALEIPED